MILRVCSRGWRALALIIACACQSPSAQPSAPQDPATAPTGEGVSNSPQPSAEPAAATSSAGSETTAEAVSDGSLPPEPAPSREPTVSETGTSGTGLAGTSPAGAIGLHKMPQVGASSTDVTGCLARASVEQQSAEQQSAEQQRSATRSAPAAKSDAVRVATTRDGLVLSHEFGHQCCLQSRTEAKVAGREVVVTAHLAGQGCRCRCNSTLTTRVGLAPGKYDVRVQVDDRGALRHVHSESVEVRASLRGGAPN